MKNKKKLLFIIILFILGFIFYTKKNYNKQKVFNDFIYEHNTERKLHADKFSLVDIPIYIENTNVDESILNDEDLEKLTNFKYSTQNKLLNTVLTIEQAQEDINYVFKLLKYSYAPYEYFGGDEVFLKKRDEILKEFESIENIKYDNIKRLLIDNLMFINDGHLSIGTVLINYYKDLVYVYNDEYIFKKNDKGFYTNIDHSKWYAESINEYNLDEFMKTTITPEGELAYSIGTLVNNNDDALSLSLNMINEKRNERVTKIIDLKKDFRTNKTPPVAFEKSIISGIPILEIMSMNNLNTIDRSMEDFIATSTELKNSKAFILDLRGNLGGGEAFWMEWLNNYIGEPVQITQRVGKKITKSKLLSLKKLYEKIGGNDEYLNYINESIDTKDYGYWLDYKFNGKWYENKNLIFVLIDKDVASASEGFLSYLKNVENVVFVGSNSRGCMLTPDVSEFVLPNSKLGLRIGTGIAFKNTSDNIDGIGFEPDIWINSSDALDRVIKLLEYYNRS